MFRTFISILLICFFKDGVVAQTIKNASSIPAEKPVFREGIVHARTSFPDHPIERLLSQINFNEGNIDKQYKQIRDSIRDEEQVASDPMYMIALVLAPVFSKTYYSSERSLTYAFAVGYEMATLVDNKQGNGKMLLQTHDLQHRATINFNKNDLPKLWEKEEVGKYEGEYSVQKSSETKVIAGYHCKKMTYVFSGTSQGPVAHSKVVTTIPWKIVIWYTDDLDAGINIQNPFYFNLNKAILIVEAEFDKEGRKKMIYEVTRLEPSKLKDDDFKLPDIHPVITHHQNNNEASLMVMNIMMMASQIGFK